MSEDGALPVPVHVDAGEVHVALRVAGVVVLPGDDRGAGDRDLDIEIVATQNGTFNFYSLTLKMSGNFARAIKERYPPYDHPCTPTLVMSR